MQLGVTRVLGALFLATVAFGADAEPAQLSSAQARQVKVVPFPAGDRPYAALLSGPPETLSMESGLVTLSPGASVGLHDTEGYEEVLVPLAGRGELRISGKPPVAIGPGMLAYSPPHTEHDVVNTGTTVLRYIFVAAKAR